MNPHIIKFAFLFTLLCVFALAILDGELLFRPATPRPVENATADTPIVVPVAQREHSQPPQAGYYSVIKVVDGDTLAIDMGGIPTTLRLIGINTPETVDPRRAVECFGKEASSKAKALLSGARVRIERDPSQDVLDKYGRTLAYVFLEDGTNFNEYMIAEGYAYEYTYHLPYKYQAQFKVAERVAREEGRGLWADGVCGLSNIVSYEATPHSSDTASSTNGAGVYTCDKNTYNCTSFTTQAEAQRVFDVCGGGANDIHKLDSDKDGVVCEGLP